MKQYPIVVLILCLSLLLIVNPAFSQDKVKIVFETDMESDVDHMVFPYIRAQDTGNRTDTRWFSVLDSRGQGVKITGDRPVSFSVWPYELGDLEKANHDYDLPRRDRNRVFVDHKLHGVGGDNSWGARTHPEYTIAGDEAHSLGFVISPVR